MRLRLQLTSFTAIRVVVNIAYRMTYPFLGVFARDLSVDVSVISTLVAKVKPELAEHRVWPLVIGVVIFAFLAALPWFGGLVSLFAVLFGLGALWLFGRGTLQAKAA